MSLSMSMESGWFSHQAICWLVFSFTVIPPPSMHGVCYIWIREIDGRDGIGIGLCFHFTVNAGFRFMFRFTFRIKVGKHERMDLFILGMGKKSHAMRLRDLFIDLLISD